MLSAFAILLLSQAQSPPPVQELPLSEVDAALEELRSLHQVPGMAIALIRNRETVYVRGYGLCSVESEKPVDADTLFALASVSKPFTSLVVMRLVDQGHLSLDRPVVELLPSLPLEHESPAAELDLLQELWKRGPATVGQVHQGLRARGAKVAYTTVQTMLNRLEQKRLVLRDTSDRVHRYQPRVAAEELAGGAVRRVIRRFFEGSSEALAARLVEHDLGPEELQRLRRLIDAHRRRGG